MQPSLLLKENESIDVGGLSVTVTRIGAGHVMLKTVCRDTAKPRASSMVPYGQAFRLAPDCQITFSYCPPGSVRLRFATGDGVTVTPGVRHAA